MVPPELGGQLIIVGLAHHIVASLEYRFNSRSQDLAKRTFLQGLPVQW